MEMQMDIWTIDLQREIAFLWHLEHNEKSIIEPCRVVRCRDTMGNGIKY